MTILPPFSLRESRIIDDEQCLRCSKCKTWKPQDQFSPKPFSRNGFHSHCRECLKLDRAASRLKAQAKRSQKLTEMAQERSSEPKEPKIQKSAKTLQKGLKSKRRAIKPVSDKRKKQNAEYSMLKAEFLMQNLYCEVFPALIATEVHHGMGREGKWLLDTSHWHAVSRAGHEWIENNRAEAAKRGFLKLRLTTDQMKDYGHHH